MKIMHACAALALSVVIAADAPAQQAPGCANMNGIGDFDFWLGEWNVSAGGQPAGSNQITKRAGDCVILERWSPGADDVPGGASLNYIDAATGRWHQLWVGTNTHITLEGGLDAEGSMALEGEITYFSAEGSRSAPMRGRWTPNEDGTVTQLFHEQDAASGAWKEWFRGTYTRKPEGD